MIDTKELRRLAQAATPHVGHACKYQDAHWLREGHVDFENADLFIASERPQEDAAFYAAANPTTVIEILDRLEDAESDALEQARLNGMGSEREAALMAKLEEAEKERDALRAKIEAMERQVPICLAEDLRYAENLLPALGLMPEDKLYALPGAQTQPAPSVPDLRESLRCACNYIDKLGGVSQQYRAMLASPEANPAPSEQDESVRKSWARFSHELHRSPDAPYPGMSDAFERHFSQSFNDREWRSESGTWAAAWKAAKRHGAQAQPAPSVPEGWKLVPIEPTEEMTTAFARVFNVRDQSGTFTPAFRAALAAAPEIKP